MLKPDAAVATLPAAAEVAVAVPVAALPAAVETAVPVAAEVPMPAYASINAGVALNNVIAVTAMLMTVARGPLESIHQQGLQILSFSN